MEAKRSLFSVSALVALFLLVNLISCQSFDNADQHSLVKRESEATGEFKSSNPLRDAVNKALAISRSDGTYVSILASTFPSNGFTPGDCSPDQSAWSWPMREAGSNLDKVLTRGKMVFGDVNGTTQGGRGRQALLDRLLVLIGSYYGTQLTSELKLYPTSDLTLMALLNGEIDATRISFGADVSYMGVARSVVFDTSCNFVGAINQMTVLSSGPYHSMADLQKAGDVIKSVAPAQGTVDQYKRLLPSADISFVSGISVQAMVQLLLDNEIDFVPTTVNLTASYIRDPTAFQIVSAGFSSLTPILIAKPATVGCPTMAPTTPAPTTATPTPIATSSCGNVININFAGLMKGL